MFIQVSRVGNAVTGSYNGKTFGVTYNEARYKEMKRLESEAAKAVSMDALKAILEEFEPLTKESYKELAETACPYIFVNNATGKFYLQLKGKILKEPLPQVLVDRILKSIEDGIDFLPLVKAWIRFLRNPTWKRDKKETARNKGRLFANYINRTYMDSTERDRLMKEQGLSLEVATELATRFQTPITQEGLLVTYKVSKELTKKWVLDDQGNKKQVPRYKAVIDENTGIVSYNEPEFAEDRVFQPAIQGTSGDAFYCVDFNGEGDKGHIIKVGHRHYLESWDQVNCNDGAFGHKGLHAGNLDYVRGYQTSGTVTHNVFIDPAMIGRFTDEGDGAVIAKEYFVYSSFVGPNRSIYHSSEYGKVTDAEYEDMLKASLKEQEEKETDRVNRNLASKEETAELIGSTDLD